MKDELIALLETFKFPVFLQGSLSKDAPYPDSFFTFWNGSSDDWDHFDNDAIGFVWDFDVNFYSSDPTLVNSIPLQVKALLKQNGWIVGGRGFDLATDYPTHTGRGIIAYKIEKNGGN